MGKAAGECRYIFKQADPDDPDADFNTCRGIKNELSAIHYQLHSWNFGMESVFCGRRILFRRYRVRLFGIRGRVI